MRIEQIIEAVDSAVGSAGDAAHEATQAHRAEMQVAHALRAELMASSSDALIEARATLRHVLATRPLSAARALVAMAEAITSAVELHTDQTTAPTE